MLHKLSLNLLKQFSSAAVPVISLLRPLCVFSPVTRRSFDPDKNIHNHHAFFLFLTLLQAGSSVQRKGSQAEIQEGMLCKWKWFRDWASHSSSTICGVWALQKTVAEVYCRHHGNMDLLSSWNFQLSLLVSCPIDFRVSLPFSLKAAASSLVTPGELAIETFSMDSSYPKEQLEGLELLVVRALLLIVFTVTKLQPFLSSLTHLSSQRPRQEASGISWPIPRWYSTKNLSVVMLCFCQKSGLVSVFSFPFPSLFTELQLLQKFHKSFLWHMPYEHMSSSCHMQITLKCKLNHFRIKHLTRDSFSQSPML